MARKDSHRELSAPKANSIVVTVTALVLDDADSVIREVKEEAGIDVEPIRITGIYTDPEHVIAFTTATSTTPLSMGLRS